MTSFSVEKFSFDLDSVESFELADAKHSNWPVVYILNNDSQVYVGESLNVANRMRQHLKNEEKRNLKQVRIVLDTTFNKSVCLHLESYLVQLFSGDGQYEVINRNNGIQDRNYFNRKFYQNKFEEIFERLKDQECLYKRSIPEIINSDLFKLSPFKSLNHDQAIAVEDILTGLFSDFVGGFGHPMIVQGGPGTGKTIIAMYLLKILDDIRRYNPDDPVSEDDLFNEFFTEENRRYLEGMKIGIVVPQQSLRKSVERVFKLIPGLGAANVLSPYDVGMSEEKFGVLVVDEAHRLNQRANQSAASLNKKFADINVKLFGEDLPTYTQLDWVLKQSNHCILLLDTGQTVRPADLPDELTKALISDAEIFGRLYPLQTQMRVKAGREYVENVRSIFKGLASNISLDMTGYDLRFFNDLGEMYEAIKQRDEEHGLSRLVAGYAWPWKSKLNRDDYDIELDGVQLRWNSTDKDWINQPGSVEEVGSIHTVQGYDLNYAGVIIGEDIYLDLDSNIPQFDRSHYFDKKGKENNPKRGIIYTNEDILTYVRNIYSVLMTRGIMGTYVYVCDKELKKYLENAFLGNR